MGMANLVRNLRPLKASLVSPPSQPRLFSTLTHSRVGKPELFKEWNRCLQPLFQNQLAGFLPHLSRQRKYLQNFSSSGNDVSVDEDSPNLWDPAGLDDDPNSIQQILKKIWLPLLLAVTFCRSGEHPLGLLVKLAIYLLWTKPSPMSLYIVIEQLRRQAVRQYPGFYSCKPLFAKKVEVKDYMVLCWAKVELIDKKITLMGILGGWWILQSWT